MSRPASAALQQLLVQALALHQQGRLAPALTLYQQVLDAAPGNFDALHLGGVAAAYLELALRLQIPLATVDGPLRDAALASGVGLVEAQ